MANQLKSRYDIIINGGGIVGFTFLNLILKSPYLKRCKVLLIEQASKPANFNQPNRQLLEQSSNSISDESVQSNNQPVFSNRVSSITKKSRLTLEKLGVWSKVGQYAKDVKKIKVWNYDYSQKIIFNQHDKQDSDIMFSVLENNRLSSAILKEIYENTRNENVIRWNESLTDLSRSINSGLIEVCTKNLHTNEEFIAYAPLVLGCDGFKSKVREFSQMKYNELNLNKAAVVGTVKINSGLLEHSSSNDIAYQRFSAKRDTVAALLPLDECHSSFVISAPSDYSKYLIDCGNERFIYEFNLLLREKESPENGIMRGLHEFCNLAATRVENFPTVNSRMRIEDSNFESDEPPRLASVVDGSRASFPLVFGSTTPKMISTLPGGRYPQLALLGDSSHRVHPLAGQGLNLGIQDANELVCQLENMMKCGERIFDDNDHSLLKKALSRYECNRQSYIIPMSAGILSMPHLFKITPASLLSTFNRLNWLKSASVKFADGC